MTTDRALEILEDKNACSECACDISDSITCNDCEEAIKIAIEAVKEAEKYKKAIEEIKQKVNKELGYQWNKSRYSDGYKDGILYVFKMIDNICE